MAACRIRRAVNVQLADRTETELQRVEREISTLQDRKLSLEAQLAVVKPTLPGTNTVGERVLTSEERLRTLQAQYATQSAVYGADHPDVRRTQREITALKAQTGASGRSDAADQLKALDAELATLKERYGEDHPDVQRIRRSIAALKASEVSATTVPKAGDRRLVVDPATRPDNPAYLVFSTQLESAKRELTQLAALRDDLRAKQRTYDARLLQIPEIEREYSELTRDYGNAQTRYREIKAKQMQAEGALELEKDSKAERFSLGEPANLPQTPFSPNRPAIALIGLVTSLGSGLGLAFLREAFDQSIKNPSELARIASVPILTAIPYIETRRDQVVKRRRMLTLVGAYCSLVIILLLVVHFFAKPIPALIESVMRKIVVM